MTIHLVTGGTGFVGGALILELLDQTDDQVIGLARPSEIGAHERLVAAVRHAAQAYGRDPATVPMHRVRGIAGDVTRDGCGVEETGLRADMMWHSAASLRYEDRYESEIRATNVGGMANALTLARNSGVSVFNAISTAYVSGRKEGFLPEVPQSPASAQNHYERTKITAEAMAMAAEGMSVRILPPASSSAIPRPWPPRPSRACMASPARCWPIAASWSGCRRAWRAIAACASVPARTCRWT